MQVGNSVEDFDYGIWEPEDPMHRIEGKKHIKFSLSIFFIVNNFLQQKMI